MSIDPGSRRLGRRALAMMLGLVLVAAGCANVPDETQPDVVQPAAGAEQKPQVPAPETGLEPIAVVRDFLEAAGQPLGEHAHARVYLGSNARKSWNPSGELRIIEDSFNTVPEPAAEQPESEDERVVLISAPLVGKLSSDGAFIPSSSNQPLKARVKLRRQANGEWRIVDPPDKLISTKSAFTEHYFRVPIYFFAKGSTTLVPDLRYVPAKPRKGLPSKVVDLLLDGPSSGLTGAVRNLLGDKVSLESNVDSAPDGALVVPLKGVAGMSRTQKKLVVAQLVTSLQRVQTFRVRPLSKGDPLVDGKYTWRESDLPSYSASSSLSSEVPGMFVLDGRVRSLADGEPVPGMAGTGAYDVVSAGVSVNGRQLAVVERAGDDVRLRVGPTDGTAQVVKLDGSRMTAPTWRPSASAESDAHTFWTVVEGRRVVRVQRTPEGNWAPQTVDASDVTSIGAISELRLSRDGTRAAAVVDGKLVVASVFRDANSATLRAPRILQSKKLTELVDVAWAGQHRLVVATSSSDHPVVRVPIDGLRMDRYSTSNLTLPVRAIAAASSRPVIAGDQRGMYKVSSVSDFWRPHKQSRADAVPFYPG